LKINNQIFSDVLQNINIFKKQVISTIYFIWQELKGESKELESQLFFLKPQVLD
jgi:hypothetical protein